MANVTNKINIGIGGLSIQFEVWYYIINLIYGLMKKIFITLLILVLPLGVGCRKAINEAVDATTGLGAVKTKLKTDAELAKVKCIELCKSELVEGTNMSNGPCIGNPIPEMPNWVCDVAHSPRQDVDNQSENQCSVFREGRASHFVEVDENCNFIKNY